MSDSELMQHIAESLRVRRKAAGYKSVAALCEHLEGMNPKRYYEYESGRTPIPIDAAVQVASACGCTLDDRGWVRVSMPLPEWCATEPENECEPAGRLRVRKDWFGSRRTFYHEVGLACGRLTVRACVPLLTAGKARMLSREEGSLRKELERLMAEDLFK